MPDYIDQILYSQMIYCDYGGGLIAQYILFLSSNNSSAILS